MMQTNTPEPNMSHCPLTQTCHREERSDVAIQGSLEESFSPWVATLQ